MRIKQILAVGASILGLAAVSLPAHAAKVEFVNQSSWEIHEIYFSPASAKKWGEDYLGDEILEKGDTLTLSGVTRGKWDVRVVDEDGDVCVLENVYLDSSDRWVINDEDLLGCQAGTDE
ncbi:hypothetical protein [Sinimarinibacterium sp. NLF-5-8]|uniref:hypothetical protein n=1 Tax=Sinimarinibacterium sp. NLF-5-8 TaxID=2698684 RepID=UPI00137C0FCA|nr:hypothetical protein [Sinimarinibacterium sp. NLF-5-8]QHS10243.1 hypothetical protein GT972_08880 [Sinimarinibacterium sp. NLF-5-8]